MVISNAVFIVMIQSIARVFPNRPLALTPRDRSGQRLILVIAGIIAVAGGFAAMFRNEIPALLSDYSIREIAEVLEPTSLRNGECTTSRGVMTTCRATLVYTPKLRPAVDPESIFREFLQPRYRFHRRNGEEGHSDWQDKN